MSAQAYSEAWKSYMHYLNIEAGGRDRSRSNPKVVAMHTKTAAHPIQGAPPYLFA